MRKSTCDGIGGTVNRLIDGISLQAVYQDTLQHQWKCIIMLRKYKNIFFIFRGRNFYQC